MSDWRNLIQQMSKFGRLSESSKVARDIVSAMTPKMRREALTHFVKESVEGQMRANARSVEVAAQLARSRVEADKYRSLLSEKHGVRFKSLEEANAYDDLECARIVQEKRQAEEDRRKKISKALIDSLHIQWSSELLDTGFKLGDGSATTWGTATMEQHETRIRMMVNNVEGNIETMKRHEAAVIALAGSGASCLAELPAPTTPEEDKAL